MEEPLGAEFQDWEVLHDSNTKGRVIASELENSSSFDGIGGDSDSEGLIKSDYFSLANEGRLAKAAAERELSEEGSVESDNPSWIDPSLENRYGGINSGEFWSDSGSDRSDERKINDYVAKNESALAEIEQSQISQGEFRADSEKSVSPESSFFTETAKNCIDFEEFDEIQSQIGADSGGDELVSGKPRDVGKAVEPSLGDSRNQRGLEVKVKGADEHAEENKNPLMEETKANTEGGGGSEGKGKMVWWKVPFEVLKYCMLRSNPVWSFSVAAAVMGFMILGRKLYKMKRKSQSLQLKVTVDDKKVSQFMTRAARLNEAFSVVRRVPIVRPALPAAGNGISPWPAMSMR